MRILVTGATGFIGRRLCTSLVSQGHFVRGVARTASAPQAGVEFQARDFTQAAAIAGSLDGIDCVIHLAGRAHVLDKRADAPELYQAVNCDATLQLARLAMDAGVKRFVFISSIGVNGNQSGQQRFDEDSTPAPTADYAHSKLDAETGLRRLLETADMEWVIIRPPLVYGADAPGNFRTLLKVVARGTPSPFGWVRNARSIVSVDNLCALISLAAQHPAAAGEVFLASDGSDVSTHQMLQALAEGMQRRRVSIPVPAPFLALLLTLAGKSDLYTQLCGSLTIDCTKAQRLLGYQPDTDTLRSLRQVGERYLSCPQ